MDEAQNEKATGKEPKETDSTFSLDVEIAGLPYVFTGKIPPTPEDLTFTLHHPNWQEEVRRLNDLATKKGGWTLELSSFEHDQGEIAYLHANPTRKQGADIYLERVRSNSWLLRESPYEDAEGLGRFLMDNFLTLADVRRWTVRAWPEASGRLSQRDLLRWLEREGFEEGHGSDLLRRPRQPDLSQPIAKLLSNDN